MDCKSWVENGYAFETVIEKLKLYIKISFLYHSIEKCSNLYIFLKFLNLVKVEEIYKSLKSWVDKFGMKLVSFARWTYFVHRRTIHPVVSPIIHRPLSTRWMIHRVEFFLIGDTPGGLSTRWTVEGGQSTPRPQSIHRWRMDHWGHSYSSSLFHFAGGEWTVDGGLIGDVAL